MKKLTLLTVMFCSLSLISCKDKKENKTIYDYLNDEASLKSTLVDCTSGKLDDPHTCRVVKTANELLDPYKHGILSEGQLKKLGKK